MFGGVNHLHVTGTGLNRSEFSWHLIYTVSNPQPKEMILFICLAIKQAAVLIIRMFMFACKMLKIGDRTMFALRNVFPI